MTVALSHLVERVYEAVGACLVAFDDLNKASKQHDKLHRVLCNLHVSFLRWVAYVGASHSAQAALEDRLELQGPAIETMLGLLYMLRQNLEWELKSSTKHNFDQSSSRLTAQAADSVLDDGSRGNAIGLAVVEATIVRLFTHAQDFRRTGVGFSTSKDSPEHLGLLNKCEELLNNNYASAPKSLRMQIAHSVYRRTMSMGYVMQHEGIWSRVFEKPVEISGTVGQGIKELDTPSSEIGPADLPVILTQNLEAKKWVDNESVENGQYCLPLDNQPRIVSTISCPICFHPMDASLLTEMDWRTHIEQDLKPFVCISESCQKPLKFFCSFSEWKEHMNYQHTCDWAANIHCSFWYCDLCSSNALHFENQSELEAHLVSHHGAMLSTSQLRGRLRRNRQSFPRDLDVCPLCAAVPVEVKTYSGEARCEALWAHIGHHMKLFASLSLPCDRAHAKSKSADKPGSKRHTSFTASYRTQSAQTQTLDAVILDSFHPSNFDGLERNFVPQQQLEQLITPAAVCKELEDCVDGSEAFNGLARWISTAARKTFAIAILCGLNPSQLAESMTTLKNRNFCDIDLPLADPRMTPPSSQIWTPQIWTTARLCDFYEKQWRLMAPIFSRAQYHYDLSGNVILPFIKDDMPPRIGAFSAVHKVKVHREHQRHVNMQHVAIKEIQLSGRSQSASDVDIAWETEANALQKINQLGHSHIIECVAAIRRGKSRYFMFPWADGDSLRDYWSRVPRQRLNARLVLDVVQQLRGLADALDHLHNFGTEGRYYPTAGSDVRVKNGSSENPNNANIRHGDLKPENILRFTDSTARLGTLKIADLGLAKQHIVATQLRANLTTTKYGTIQYEAPEAITGHGARSRLYDIWSMGCITLEFIIWMLYGNDELHRFYGQIRDKTEHVTRYYIANSVGRPKVHPVVLDWIHRIKATDPECSQVSAIGDLLDLVHERLLVVSLSPTRMAGRDTGTAIYRHPTTYRATAAEFRDALDTILSKSRDWNYFHVGGNHHIVSLTDASTSKFATPRVSLLSSLPTVHSRSTSLSDTDDDVAPTAAGGGPSRIMDRACSTPLTVSPLQQQNESNDIRRLVNEDKYLQPDLTLQLIRPSQSVNSSALQNHLLSALQRSNSLEGFETEFIPAGNLDKLVNSASVHAELNNMLGAQMSTLELQLMSESIAPGNETIQGAQFSKKSFRMVFAILVMLNMTPAIRQMLGEDVSDAELPLSPLGTPRIKGFVRKPSTNEDAYLELRTFQQWSPVQLRNFYEWQWKLLAPIFCRDDKDGVQHYQLSEQHILPFTASNDSGNADKKGGYGRVSMVNIHKDHHNFGSGPNGTLGFAVKQQVHEKDRNVFSREIDVLKKFSGSRTHPHINPLLATFEQHGKLHMIFYRATSDMLALWTDGLPDPVFNLNNVGWMVKQCHGLTEGLLRVHRYVQDEDVESELISTSTVTVSTRRKLSWTPRKRVHPAPAGKRDSLSRAPSSTKSSREQQFGRHGDINPNNILWFADKSCCPEHWQGSLKISDFGQAEINSFKSKTKAREVAITASYRPPECDVGYTRIRQTFDIWCLGCVFLEFLAWLLAGSETVREFSKQRLSPDRFQEDMAIDSFFKVDKIGSNTYQATLKESVVEFIDWLHKRPNCSQCVHDFLNIIETQMLLVDARDRIHCGKLEKQLSNMYHRCMDSTYAVASAPWVNDTPSAPKPMIFRRPDTTGLVLKSSLSMGAHRQGRSSRGRLRAVQGILRSQ